MADTSDTQQDASGDKLPEWYREIFPAGAHDGFYEKLGQHALIHVDRGTKVLVITFDNLSDAGYPDYDVKAWAEKFIRDSGHSHLGVVAQGPTWFRDARLIERMEKLAASGFFARFDRVVMAGTSMGGFGALAFADLAPGCDVIAFSPQTTLSEELVPWEKRFGPGRAQDWTLPRSDAAKTVGNVRKLWVILDPFFTPDLKQIQRLPEDKISVLKSFGQGHKTALVLRRMDLLKDTMTKAIDGTLSEKWFYSVTRKRKDLYLYRKTMEDHLQARGKQHRIPAFVAAFRTRARARQAQEAGKEGSSSAASSSDADTPRRAVAAMSRQNKTDAHITVETELQRPSRKPRTLGNVWNLSDDGVTLRYLSDQYRHQVMGFEERNGVTLAQSPQVALGMVSVGGTTAIPRPLPERFEYHIRDEFLSQDTAPQGAEAQGVAVLSYERADCRALRTVFALSHPKPGITAAEIHPDSPYLQDVMDRIQDAKSSAQEHDRILYVDRISMDLLAGDLTMDELTAASHYIDTIRTLREHIARAADQISYPHVTITQKPGTRTNGKSEVALAEGRLDIHEPGLGILVASPSYMLEFMPDTVATIAPKDRMWLDELEALAVRAAQNGERWFCPAMRQVFRRGTDLVVEFATMGPLELDPKAARNAHGFTLDGCVNDAQITGLHFEPTFHGGQRLVLSLDRFAEGPGLSVNYAWGMMRDAPHGEHPANHGALRETWSRPSLLQPERRLYRYALSGRLPVMPSELAGGVQ